MSNKSYNYVLRAILAFGLLSAAFSAHAADDTSVPGTACSPSSESSTLPLTHLPTGGIVNNYTSQLPVICPVQRDNPGVITGAWASVYVNNPSGKTTTCVVFSNDVNGTTVDSQSKSTSATGFQALQFTNIDVSAAWGNYTVVCSLPAGGTLYSYYFLED